LLDIRARLRVHHAMKLCVPTVQRVLMFLGAIATPSCATGSTAAADAGGGGVFVIPDAGKHLDVGVDTGMQPISMDTGLPPPTPDASMDTASTVTPEASTTSDAMMTSHDGSTGVDAAPPPVDSGGGGVPTTCSEANGTKGCCTSAGVLYYCAASAPTTLKSETCTGTKPKCGWDTTSSYYNCGTTTASAPSDTPPQLCP
jgi:hypothetical protein